MTPAGGGAPVGGTAGPAVAAHRSWAYTALWTLVFDEDFTYGMGATWITYFLTLGVQQATMAAVAGEAARFELDVDVGSIRGSSGYKKQSYDFLVSSSSSLTAQLLAAGGESSSHGDILHALRLGFVGKIRRARAAIYRAFGTYV
jgi:hypothetical protein